MGVQCLIESIRLAIFFVFVIVNKSPEETKHTVGLGIVVEFVDKEKNMEYH